MAQNFDYVSKGASNELIEGHKDIVAGLNGLLTALAIGSCISAGAPLWVVVAVAAIYNLGVLAWGTEKSVRAKR